jgi:hypothetical protein
MRKKRCKLIFWLLYTAFWVLIFIAARAYAVKARASDGVIGNEDAWGGEALIPIGGLLIPVYVKGLTKREDEDA